MHGHTNVMTLSEYLFLNLSDYENIQIDMQINLIVLAFAIGIVIATIVLGFYRSAVQTLIKQLTRHEATDVSTAKTLSELSLSGKQYVFVLKSSSMLKQMVARVGEENVSKAVDGPNDEKSENAPEIDYSTAAFYLRASGEERTKKVLSGYEASLVSSILLSILILAIAACITLCMPAILDLVNSILGWF